MLRNMLKTCHHQARRYLRCEGDPVCRRRFPPVSPTKGQRTKGCYPNLVYQRAEETDLSFTGSSARQAVSAGPLSACQLGPAQCIGLPDDSGRVGPPNRRHRFGVTLLHEIVTMGDHVTAEERVAFTTAALFVGPRMDLRLRRREL